jgi:hypothetical protein
MQIFRKKEEIKFLDAALRTDMIYGKKKIGIKFLEEENKYLKRR